MGFFNKVLAVAALGLSATQATAATIGINFVGGGVSLDTTDVAGAPGVAQANYNNITGTTTGSPTGGFGGAFNDLLDNTGAVGPADLVFSAGGNYQAGNASPVGGDEKLFRGFQYGNTNITITSVPYAEYDVYFYGMNDAAGRNDEVSLNGGPAVSLVSLAPGGAGFVDGNGATPFTYVQGPGSGNFLRFQGVTGSSFTLSVTATGNGFTNGLQIVQVPEPASAAALGLAAVGLMARRRRARSV